MPSLHSVTMALDAMGSGTRSLHKAKYGLKCNILYSIKELMLSCPTDPTHQQRLLDHPFSIFVLTLRGHDKKEFSGAITPSFELDICSKIW